MHVRGRGHSFPIATERGVQRSPGARSSILRTDPPLTSSPPVCDVARLRRKRRSRQAKVFGQRGYLACIERAFARQHLTDHGLDEYPRPRAGRTA